jgi:type I restriction-modification system DNA methylase subunit
MFVPSEKFIESHGGRFGDISIDGQEANATTWGLVAMNLAVRGMDFNLGREPADTFHRDQHPDLKTDHVLANGSMRSNQSGEVMFIDARQLGRLETRVLRVFDDEDVRRIAGTVHRWRRSGEAGSDEPHADGPGSCRSVTLAEIVEHGHVLTPGRYGGAEATDDDDEGFAEKMERLTAPLAEPMATGAELDEEIRRRLAAVGYAL